MMELLYQKEGGEQRVKQLALSLSGLSEAPSAEQALYEAAVNFALVYCHRVDIPPEMEHALALVLSDLYRDGVSRPVSSVRRGDTNITYADQGGRAIRVFAPFVRLKTI